MVDHGDRLLLVCSEMSKVSDVWRCHTCSTIKVACIDLTLAIFRMGHRFYWEDFAEVFQWSCRALYLTQPRGRTGSRDTYQFYHIYIFKYYRNKCRIIISIKEGSSFCQLTLSFNTTCMPFQHYHLQNIIRVHLHK